MSGELSLSIGRPAFAEIEPLWRALEERAEISPFQTYDWARAWLDHLAPDAEPWLVARDGTRPLLLALAARRRGGSTWLTLLGHGPSDYLGPLPPELADADAVAIARAIGAARDRFDLLQLRGWSSSDAARDGFVASLDGRTALRAYEICPFVDTSGRWDDYLATRTKKFRANLKRTARRAEQAGAVTIGREAVDARLFDELVEVERESWKWEHGFAFLRDPRSRAFLRAVLLDSPLERELWTLRVGEVLAAFALVFPRAASRYYYLPSFRQRFPDVGTQLLRAIVEDSFSAGFTRFDFLQGDEDYKRPWATDSRSVYEIAGAGRGMRGALAVRALELRWRAARSARLRMLRERVHLARQSLRGGAES